MLAKKLGYKLSSQNIIVQECITLIWFDIVEE